MTMSLEISTLKPNQGKYSEIGFKEGCDENNKKKPKFQTQIPFYSNRQLPQFNIIGFMAIRSWKSNFNVKAQTLQKIELKEGKKHFNLVWLPPITTKHPKKPSFLKKPKSRIWKTHITQFCKFFDKNFNKTKTFPWWYLFIGKKQMSKCLSRIDHSGNMKEKKWREEEEEWRKIRLVRVFKKIDPFALVRKEGTCLSVKKK